MRADLREGPMPPPSEGSFDLLLLSRIEDASLNASAPRQQRWLDGWLVRACPGKAKRARSIQAVASGRMTVPARLSACRAVYEEAGLPMYVRITPFSLPEGLDDELASLGMRKLDDTRVMVISNLRPHPASPGGTPLLFETTDAGTFAEWVGAARGSPAAERSAHAARLSDAPVPLVLVLVRDEQGSIVAAGHVAIEADLAGLYDVITVETHRQRGIGASLCRHLLAEAAARGVRTAYLQVDAGNQTARRLYRRLGFADGYAYHYRAMPG